MWKKIEKIGKRCEKNWKKKLEKDVKKIEKNSKKIRKNIKKNFEWKIFKPSLFKSFWVKFLNKLTFCDIWIAAFLWLICLWAAAARFSWAVTAELNATGFNPEAKREPRAFDKIKSIENCGFWPTGNIPCSRPSCWKFERNYNLGTQKNGKKIKTFYPNLKGCANCRNRFDLVSDLEKFWPSFRFLTKILFFWPEYRFLPKFWFLIKMLIFTKISIFLSKLLILGDNCFVRNLDF